MSVKIDASEFYNLQKDQFHVLDPYTLIPNDLDTGDIILFSRRCSDMNMYGALLCMFAKQYSEWDHICVVVKDPATGINYALEAALTGIELFEVNDRICHSKAPSIAIRYLRINRTDEQREQIWSLVNEMKGKPYMSDKNTLMKANSWSNQKFTRMILQSRLYFLQQRYQAIESSLRKTAYDSLSFELMHSSLTGVKEEYEEVQQQLQQERKSRLETEETQSEFFCSQSVAAVLKAMGVLPPLIPSTEYMPYSFSSEVNMPLLKGATFSGEVFIRGTRKSGVSIEEKGKEEEEEEKKEEKEEKKEGEKKEEEKEENLPSRNLTALDLTSEDDLRYIVSQLKLTRVFGRCSYAVLSSLLKQANITCYLPGDLLHLSNADFLIGVSLQGDTSINDSSQQLGEYSVEKRSRFGLLGYAAHPTDIMHLLRIGQDDIGAIASLSSQELQEYVKEAPGIHKFERLRLMKCMQYHPAFQHLSWGDRYCLTYFFYKVKLEKGDCLVKEGYTQNYIYFIDKGKVVRRETEKRGWKNKDTSMKEGTFPGVLDVLRNQPSNATYEVEEDSAEVFVLDPSILAYYTANKQADSVLLLRCLRSPTSHSILTTLTNMVYGNRVYSSDEVLTRLKSEYATIRASQDSLLPVNDTLQKQVFALIELCKLVYYDPDIERDTNKHKEGVDYAVATGIDTLEAGIQQLHMMNMPSIINGVYNAVSSFFGYEEGVEPSEIVNKESVEKGIREIKEYNNINDYTEGQILTLLHSFQYEDTQDTAVYLLFIALCGVAEDATLTRTHFIKQARKLGILNESNHDRLVSFLFSQKDSLSFSDFYSVMQKDRVPASIAERIDDIKSIVIRVVPEQKQQYHENDQIIREHREMDKATLHLHSPFALIHQPFPLPYMFTYAAYHENPSISYASYVIGSFFGEVFGRFILYPLYLSSFTHLRNADCRPSSLSAILLGDKEKRCGLRFRRKKTTIPAAPVFPAKTTLHESMQANSKLSKLPKPAVITISDDHVKSVSKRHVVEDIVEEGPVLTKKSALNPLVGGCFRYVWLLLVERSLQVACFPFILRSVKDNSVTTDFPIAMQSAVAGSMVGSILSVVKHPMDRAYLLKMTGTTVQPSSLLKRLYAGFLPSFVYYSLFNGILFGSIVGLWGYLNKEYAKDYGFAHSLPHQRDLLDVPNQPIHYNVLGKSIIVISCGYAAAQGLCYPINVYKNFKVLRSCNAESLSPLYEKASSLRQFFAPANRKVLYGGFATRVCWSILSCSMGITFGSALLTKKFRDDLK